MRLCACSCPRIRVSNGASRMASGFLDVLRIVEGYTLEVLVDKIKTPILVLDAPDDQFQ